MWIDQVRQLLAKAKAPNAWKFGDFSGLVPANDGDYGTQEGERELSQVERARMVMEIVRMAGDHRLSYYLTPANRRAGCNSIADLSSAELIELYIDMGRQAADYLDLETRDVWGYGQ